MVRGGHGIAILVCSRLLVSGQRGRIDSQWIADVRYEPRRASASSGSERQTASSCGDEEECFEGAFQKRRWRKCFMSRMESRLPPKTRALAKRPCFVCKRVEEQP